MRSKYRLGCRLRGCVAELATPGDSVEQLNSLSVDHSVIAKLTKMRLSIHIFILIVIFASVLELSNAEPKRGGGGSRGM